VPSSKREWKWRVCRCGTCVSKHGRPVKWFRGETDWTSEFREKAKA